MIFKYLNVSNSLKTNLINYLRSTLDREKTILNIYKNKWNIKCE